MKYKSREMRRLYEVYLYAGDPDDPDTEIVTETVVAWNAVDAVRRCSGRRAASEPVMVDHVSWDEPPLIIKDTSGPTDEVVKPSIVTEEY